MLVLQERHPCTFLHVLCHYSCVAYILRIVVRFGRHDAFYLWQVWWSAQAGRKGKHELCSSQPHKPPTNHPARPLMQKFFRCAGQGAFRRRRFFVGGGAPKMTAGTYNKSRNAHLAAAVLEIKEP